MITFRDVKLAVQGRLDEKQDKQEPLRGVITDALGNQSGAGSIWADFDTKRVWYMAHGAATPAMIRCTRLPNPYIGLKILVGYTPGSRELEVLSDDPFDRLTNPSGGDWTALESTDLQPGGRAMLWLQTKAVIPLAVWPVASVLKVNVNPGAYIYAGTEQAFAGVQNYDLSGHQPAGPDEQLLIGLYLDAAGTLQTIDSLTVGTDETIPEPVWPAGAFKLAVVRLNDTQTEFDFVDDVTDRRLLWFNDVSEAVLPLTTKGDLLTFTTALSRLGVSGNDGWVLTEDSTQPEGVKWAASGGGGGGNVWPKAGECGISDTQYASWALMIAALAANQQGLVGEGTFVTDWTGGERLAAGADLRGCGIDVSVLTDDDTVILQALGNNNIQDITLINTKAGGGTVFSVATAGDMLLNRVETQMNSAGINLGFNLASGGGTIISMVDCAAKCWGGALDQAISVSDVTTVRIFGGDYVGNLYASGAGCVVELYYPRITGILTAASGAIIKGWYFDGNGKLHTIGLNTGLLDVLNGTCEGRLTLTSGTPVTTSGITAATTLYYTPHVGNRIALYTSSFWELYTFTELSIAIPATTNTNYDVFMYDNAGTLTLSLTAWTNNTTRATALVYQDGVLVKSGATNYRYLGTIRTTNVSGQCADSLYRRFCWNMYNRESKMLRSYNTNASWNVVGGPVGPREFNTGTGQVRAEFVLGQQEFMSLVMNGYVSACAAGNVCALYGNLDGGGLTGAICDFQGDADGTGVFMIIGPAIGYVIPSIGYHYFTQYEYIGSTATIYPGSGTYCHLITEVRC